MNKDNRSYKVLVIEDNQGDLMIVEDFLLEKIPGVKIKNAGSFKKASDMLRDNNAVFDAILLDLTLPDKSGQPLITEILGLSKSCPVIILTGNMDIDFSIRSISQGITDYLIKDDLNGTTLYKSIVYAIERKKTSFKLKESEKRYSDIFRLSPQPMWVYEVESLRFSQVNKAAMELYGYNAGEFLDMTILDVMTEDDELHPREEAAKNIQEMMQSGESKHKKKSGEIIDVQVYSTPIIIDNKSYRSVVAIDITEKNLLEYKVTKAIIKTQEDERYEIGAELHDNVCQLLASSKLTLGMLKESMSADNLQWYNQCDQYIVMALDEIRNLSHRLAPAFFDDTTLEDAFNKLLNTFNVQNKYEISVQFNNGVNKFPVSTEITLCLYRILQEQLKNILKYAKAGIIEVNVAIYFNKIIMSITDDGVGFNVEKVKGGIGLANMKRRVSVFSGKLKIEASPGKGCTIVVDIPLLETNQPVLLGDGVVNRI